MGFEGAMMIALVFGQIARHQPHAMEGGAGRVIVAPANPNTPEKVFDTTAAAASTLQDLLILKAQGKDTHDYRYLMVQPGGDQKVHQINSWLVNSVSSASVIRLPDGVGGGHLIRWHLPSIAPNKDDLRRLKINWDALSNGDEFFHVLVRDHEKVAPFTHIDGKTYNARRFVPAPHVEVAYRLLEKETNSFAPLLRADDFLRRVGSTIEGGSYYHFASFVQDGKRLNEQQIFEQVGLSVATSRKVEGDDRVAMWESGVTRKNRAVEFIQGAVGDGRVSYDVLDDNRADPKKHAMYNLLDFVEKADGKEIIFDRKNGLHGFILVDGKGALVDVAPQALVTDSEVPRGHTANLFPPLSCVRCHGPQAGVKDCPNDVASLLANGFKGGVDVYDDLSDTKATREETVDRLAGLYAGDFTERIRLARNRYADAVNKATGGMSVEDMSAEFARQYESYWQTKVTPEQACLEHGYRVKDGEGAAYLKKLVGTRSADVEIDGVPIAFTDPATEALFAGQAIPRQDFNRTFADRAYQISRNKEVSK